MSEAERGPKTGLPSLAVILATRNRAPLLGEALASLVEPFAPQPPFELLVVDNGSTDETPQVIEDFARRYPGCVRRVDEPVAGLSRARNTGLRASSAEVLAFFDDDARAHPGWIAGLQRAFANPRAAAVGGPIDLDWRCPRPDWWEPGLDGEMGRLDYGDRPVALAYPRTPYGMNFAVRRSIFRQVGLFRESLGRRGRSLIAAEELELCLRIWQAGREVWYEPQARVIHRVEAPRVRMDYIRSRAYWHGRSQRRAETLTNTPRSKSKAVLPGFFLKSLGGYLLKHRLSRVRQRELIFYLGYAVEAWGEMGSPPADPPPPLEETG